jgi:hypothetical protein
MRSSNPYLSHPHTDPERLSEPDRSNAIIPAYGDFTEDIDTYSLLSHDRYGSLLRYTPVLLSPPSCNTMFPRSFHRLLLLR